MKTVPEPNAELVSADDVHRDASELTAALERRRAERQAYDILSRPDVRQMLDQLIASGGCANEEEPIGRALRTLVTAVTRSPAGGERGGVGAIEGGRDRHQILEFVGRIKLE